MTQNVTESATFFDLDSDSFAVFDMERLMPHIPSAKYGETYDICILPSQAL